LLSKKTKERYNFRNWAKFRKGITSATGGGWIGERGEGREKNKKERGNWGEWLTKRGLTNRGGEIVGRIINSIRLWRRNVERAFQREAVEVRLWTGWKGKTDGRSGLDGHFWGGRRKLDGIRCYIFSAEGMEVQVQNSFSDTWSPNKDQKGTRGKGGGTDATDKDRPCVQEKNQKGTREKLGELLPRFFAFGGFVSPGKGLMRM